jgi:CheY-like chemotaxis protein
MDMQMPVMDGLAATRAIRLAEAARPERARTPVIMLSANAMRQHREEALAAGADLHLAKPVTAASLLGAVGQALDLAPPAAAIELSRSNEALGLAG